MAGVAPPAIFVREPRPSAAPWWARPAPWEIVDTTESWARTVRTPLLTLPASVLSVMCRTIVRACESGTPDASPIFSFEPKVAVCELITTRSIAVAAAASPACAWSESAKPSTVSATATAQCRTSVRCLRRLPFTAVTQGRPCWAYVDDHDGHRGRGAKVPPAAGFTRRETRWPLPGLTRWSISMSQSRLRMAPGESAGPDARFRADSGPLPVRPGAFSADCGPSSYRWRHRSGSSGKKSRASDDHT